MPPSADRSLSRPSSAFLAKGLLPLGQARRVAPSLAQGRQRVRHSRARAGAGEHRMGIRPSADAMHGLKDSAACNNLRSLGGGVRNLQGAGD